jgi:nicotinamidase-related amidase
MRELRSFDPPSTALLVIDLQGALSQQTYPRTTDDVVASAIALIAAARESEIKVIHVRAGNEPDGLDWIYAETEDDRPRRVWGRDDMRIDERVAPRDDDLVITKRQWGSFYGSGLELQLRRRGLDTLILCGIATNFAVESTARDGWERGFRLLFAEDAMAGLAPGDHEFAVTKIFPRLGRILSTAELIDVMHASKTAN